MREELAAKQEAVDTAWEEVYEAEDHYYTQLEENAEFAPDSPEWTSAVLPAEQALERLWDPLH